MTEKLIEILSRYFQIGDSYAYNLTRDKAAFSVGTMRLEDFEEFDEVTIADIADHLLANGVIVPPCKVGDTLYYCIDLGDIVHGQVLEIKVLRVEIQDKMRFYVKTVKHYRYNYTWLDSTDFGKTVFLTREEAEKALAETTDKRLQE